MDLDARGDSTQPRKEVLDQLKKFLADSGTSDDEREGPPKCFLPAQPRKVRVAVSHILATRSSSMRTHLGQHVEYGCMDSLGIRFGWLSGSFRDWEFSKTWSLFILQNVISLRPKENPAKEDP